jgi:hypothetical protein
MTKTLKLLTAFSAFVVMMFAMTFATMAAETITPSKATMGTEKAVTKSYSFNQNDVMEKYQYGIVIPVKVSEAGALEIQIDVTKLEKNISVQLFTDSACKNSVSGSYGYISQSDSQSDKFIAVSFSGTYYLKVSSSVYDTEPAFTNEISISTRLFPKSDRTIKSGQTIKYYRVNGTDKYYFKYKAEKTGKVTVTLPYGYGSYLTLTNAKKKVISEEEWVSSINNNQFTFAVKKGTTYYFLVTSNGVSAGNFQSITVKNTAIKEKSGAKKKKAVAIKAKKTVKGTILPESKAADWYKITVKKKKAVTINFNCNVTGGLVITVYTKGGKKIGDNTNSGSNQSLALTYSTTYQKVNKGTYYIKISRKNSLSSGTYSLKWK